MTLEQSTFFDITASNIVAVLAFLLSAFAVWKTAKFNKRQEAMIDSQTKVNQRLLELGEKEDVSSKKAELGANLVKLGSSKYRVKVFNKGQATAKNVRLSTITEDSPLIQSDIDGKFPLSALEMHQSVDLIAAVHMGSPAKSEVKIIWDDDYQSNREKIVFLTL